MAATYGLFNLKYFFVVYRDVLYENYLEQFALIQMNLAREVSRRLRALDERLSRLDTELLRVINVL